MRPRRAKQRPQSCQKISTLAKIQQLFWGKKTEPLSLLINIVRWPSLKRRVQRNKSANVSVTKLDNQQHIKQDARLCTAVQRSQSLADWLIRLRLSTSRTVLHCRDGLRASTGFRLASQKQARHQHRFFLGFFLLAFRLFAAYTCYVTVSGIK